MRSKLLTETSQTTQTREGELDTITTVRSFATEVEPPFVKVYFEDIGRLFNLQGGHKNILIALSMRMNYEGEIVLSKVSRERIAEEVGCSKKSISNALDECLKAGILKRIATNHFLVDPNLIAKGKWAEIRQRQKTWNLVIKYDMESKKRVIDTYGSDEDILQSSLDFNSTDNAKNDEAA